LSELESTMRLKDKVAVVTGGGAGIGLAIADLFAEEGAHVYVTDVNRETATAAAEALKGRGLAATAMTVDVSKGQDVTALFNDVKRDHGRADVVVNNAGINVRSDFRTLSDADWVRIREVNLDGVLRIARDAYELLKASGSGSLINVASILGHRGMYQVAGYSATKGAVGALTRALAVEYAPYGIRVNALAPGFIETALTDQVLKFPALKRVLLDKTPMRRFGTPKDIARAALFFASDDSLFVTGAELAVDGGMGAGL
jgi:NAD(P)-dependent dehydrogenase (short-subunit alcohol dehydrogenase family)